MITENGTIKVKTTLDGKMQAELTRKARVLVLVSLIVGAIGTGVFLVTYVISEYINFKENTALIFLICFALILGLGIGLLVVINNSVKAVNALPKINEYEFFKDYFTIDQTLNGENAAHAKVYNNQITKSQESKNYLFFYIGIAAYPVLKSELTEAELNTLRIIFRLPAKGGAVQLAAEAPCEDKQPPAAQDPFEDLKN